MQQRQPASSSPSSLASRRSTSSSSSKCIVDDSAAPLSASSSGIAARRKPAAQLQLLMSTTTAAKATRKSMPTTAQRVLEPAASDVDHHRHHQPAQHQQLHQSNRRPPPQQPGRNTSVGKSASAQHPQEALGDEMPVQFVTAMRTLFDIMDDQCTGYVRLQDIERRWQDDGAAGQPHGVIDSLRKVTPANGLLSFERFCAGLKICLLRNQNHHQHGSSSSSSRADVEADQQLHRPAGSKASTVQQQHRTHNNNTAAIRPSHRPSTSTASGAFPLVHRALSMPKLCTPPASSGGPTTAAAASASNAAGPRTPPTFAPPKPPRTALVLGNGVTNINHLDQLDKAEIRHALQTWQMGVLMNEMDAREKRADETLETVVKRGTADGGSTDSGTTSRSTAQHRVLAAAAGGRRHEARRHTLQNGIDYNLLKQLKLCEQEKELLVQGMDALNAAREWHVRQLADVQDRIQLLGKSDTYQNTNAAHGHLERLHLQRVRIAQASRQLAVLTDDHTAIAALPQHMHHLAVRHTSTGINPPASRIQHDALLAAADVTQRLKEKNRQLGDDVAEKSQYIAMLERERKTLIRELLQAQRNVVGTGGARHRDGSARITAAVGSAKRTGDSQVHF